MQEDSGWERYRRHLEKGLKQIHVEKNQKVSRIKEKRLIIGPVSILLVFSNLAYFVGVGKGVVKNCMHACARCCHGLLQCCCNYIE